MVALIDTELEKQYGGGVKPRDRAWWMSPSEHPKANNRRVLTPYSEDMKQLLRRRRYNSGVRPSEHHIGKKSFLADHGGAIPPNVLVVSNTLSNGDFYLAFCRIQGMDFNRSGATIRYYF